MLSAVAGQAMDALRRPAVWRQDVLNRYDRASPMAGEAEVKYLDGDFRVVRPGAFVRCAVTGVPIPLEELKYWSVDLQEPYANPEAVLQRHFPDAASDERSRSISGCEPHPKVSKFSGSCRKLILFRCHLPLPSLWPARPRSLPAPMI